MLPIKRSMCWCVALSAVTVAAVPLAAGAGLDALVLWFAVVGMAGSALISFTTTSACWSFPGRAVAPVLAGCSGAWGMTSALLPSLMYPMRGSIVAIYGIVALSAAPALTLLLANTQPAKPVHEAGASAVKGGAAGRPGPACCGWGVVFAVAAAQFLLQGANSSMLGWLVSFGHLQLHHPNVAPVFVSVLQMAVMLGSLAAVRYQQFFALWDLACGQVALVVIGLALWLPFAGSTAATLVAVAFYGLMGGPTLTYCSSIYNQHRAPSGLQLSIIGLGSNAGANFAPYAVGMLMQRLGPAALVWTALLANGLVLAGMLAGRAWLRLGAEAPAAGHTEPLLAKVSGEACGVP